MVNILSHFRNFDNFDQSRLQLYKHVRPSSFDIRLIDAIFKTVCVTSQKMKKTEKTWHDSDVIATDFSELTNFPLVKMSRIDGHEDTNNSATIRLKCSEIKRGIQYLSQPSVGNPRSPVLSQHDCQGRRYSPPPISRITGPIYEIQTAFDWPGQFIEGTQCISPQGHPWHLRPIPSQNVWRFVILGFVAQSKHIEWK